VRCPRTWGIKISNPAGANSYPITSQTFIVVNQDLCKAGTPGGETAAKGVVKVHHLRPSTKGSRSFSQATTRRFRRSILAKSKTACAALECNGSPIGG